MKKNIEFATIDGTETTQEWVAKLQRFSKLNPQYRKYKNILDLEKVVLLRDLKHTALERMTAGYRVGSERIILRCKRAILKADLELRLLEKKYR